MLPRSCPTLAPARKGFPRVRCHSRYSCALVLLQRLILVAPTIRNLEVDFGQFWFWLLPPHEAWMLFKPAGGSCGASAVSLLATLQTALLKRLDTLSYDVWYMMYVKRLYLPTLQTALLKILYTLSYICAAGIPCITWCMIRCDICMSGYLVGYTCA